MKKQTVSTLVIGIAVIGLAGCGAQQTSAGIDARSVAAASSQPAHGQAVDPSRQPVNPVGGEPTRPSSGNGLSLDKAGPNGGIVTGHLFGTGGVAPGTKVTWAGTVTVTGKGVRRVVKVGDDGAYSLIVPPGTYSVSGASPAHTGSVSCPASKKAHVTAGRTVTVDVICPIP